GISVARRARRAYSSRLGTTAGQAGETALTGISMGSSFRGPCRATLRQEKPDSRKTHENPAGASPAAAIPEAVRNVSALLGLVSDSGRRSTPWPAWPSAHSGAARRTAPLVFPVSLIITQRAESCQERKDPARAPLPPSRFVSGLRRLRGLRPCGPAARLLSRPADGAAALLPSTAAQFQRGEAQPFRKSFVLSPPPSPSEAGEECEEGRRQGPGDSRPKLSVQRSHLPARRAGQTKARAAQRRSGTATKTTAVETGRKRAARNSVRTPRSWVSTTPSRRARLGLPLAWSGAKSSRSSTACTATMTLSPQSAHGHGRKSRPATSAAAASW